MKALTIKTFWLFSILSFFTACKKEDIQFQLSDQVPDFPDKTWVQVASPEAHGWNKALLESAERFSLNSGSKAVMVIEDNKLIYSWGDCDEKYYVASVRKSFLGLLYGYYVGDEISLEATLNDYQIDDKNPSLNELEKQATIGSLLSSTSGVYHPSAASDNNDNLPARNSKAPGEVFFYNNWDFNALGTIFEQRTGHSLFKVFHDSIGSRIGLQDFNYLTDGRYDYSEVSLHPAYHFDMTARDMARIGVLVLNKGQWEGRQVLPAAWIDTITTAKTGVSREDYGGGSYGYMWWVNNGGYLVDYSGLPTDAFSAQGNWSQLILVIPSRKMVIVHRAKQNLDPARTLAIIRLILRAKAIS